MMTQQLTQRIDGLGRVLLPRDLREGLDWCKGDLLSVSKGNNKVILQLQEKCPDAKCAYCGKPEREVCINGKDICGNCLERIAEALEIQNQD